MAGKQGVTIGALLMAVLVLGSCDSFFSTSLGKERDYNTANVDVNASNVDSWIQSAKGNPKLAATLTDKIKQELKSGNLSAKDKAKLQAAGVSLALEASGIGPSMISNASDAINKLQKGDVNALPNVLKELQSDFKANNGPKAADNLAEIVGGSLPKAPGEYKTGEVPSFTNDEYAANAKPADVGQAVVLLAIAVIDEKDMNNIKLDDLNKQGISINNEGRAVVTENHTPESVALAAYLNLIADDKTGKYDNNPVTSSIKSGFGMGKS
jgi:hypothetical protein